MDHWTEMISSACASAPACVKTKEGGEIKDNSSITAVRRHSDCLCPDTKEAGKKEKKEAYQRKTQHAFLRQKDIGNETVRAQSPMEWYKQRFRFLQICRVLTSS